MNDHDEQDELWTVLGKAREPAVSMRFTQDVLRAVQKERPRSSEWFEWLRRALAPTAAVAFGALALLGVLWMNDTPSDDNGVVDEIAFEEIANLDNAIADTTGGPDEDFEIISDLDVLLASEENQLWIEDSSPF